MPDFLLDGPDETPVTILLAHGAGGPMDSASLNAMTAALVEVGLRVARFEFGYMAARRTSHARRPPPRAETLKSEYIAAVGALEPRNKLVIGGKSMGGRVASMIADELYSSGRIAGLLCLGYPFHPVGRPGQLRTAHLVDMQTPTLVVQGARDPFGAREEVVAYRLSKSIEVLWLEDGNHDLVPRKTVGGLSAAGHRLAMANYVASWASELAKPAAGRDDD